MLQSLYMNTTFKPTWLYIKRHKASGLLYFGKTVKDPKSYLGSGRYWVQHCSKHGKDKVETVWAERFEQIDDIVEFATFFSEFINIVGSPKWANMKPENGLDGGGPGPSSETMKMAMANPLVRMKCAIAKIGKPGTKHKNETKAKIGLAQQNLSSNQRLNKSLAKLGDKNGMTGKRCFNNGTTNKAFVPGSEPIGWIRGRLFKKALPLC